MKLNQGISDSAFLRISYVSIVLFSLFPLLFSVPFRIHLDLPYDGAYRLYLGQVPFRDFGMPLGYGFFIVPTAFFYLTGPKLVSLLYAQAFLNIISGCALVSVLKSLKYDKAIVFVSVLLYCLSYIFIYFWPWHTHTAFTYGLIAIAFLLKMDQQPESLKTKMMAIAAGVFSFLSFFTKQDYGGLSLVFCGVLLVVQTIYSRRFAGLLIFAASYVVTALVFIVPLLKYGFGYWFNHGQPPHTARLAPIDFLNEFFMGSDWEKFYLLAFAVILIAGSVRISDLVKDKLQVFRILVCAGMIAEALLTKVTSRMSTGTTTYYHAFAIAFILGHIPQHINLRKPAILAVLLLFTFFWWSPMYWKYASRILPMPQSKIPRKSAETKVQVGWELSEFKTLKKVKIPVATIEGIRRLQKMEIFSRPDSLQVMNMTELTSLPEELHYKPLAGIPLWFDLGVAIFPQQVSEICKGIETGKYDVFLFEEVPSLDNFYPEEVRLCLQKHYKLADTFLAPRKEEDSTIEVYVRK